jgi:hypothetical protein
MSERITGKGVKGAASIVTVFRFRRLPVIRRRKLRSADPFNHLARTIEVGKERGLQFSLVTLASRMRVLIFDFVSPVVVSAMTAVPTATHFGNSLLR